MNMVSFLLFNFLQQCFVVYENDIPIFSIKFTSGYVAQVSMYKGEHVTLTLYRAGKETLLFLSYTVSIRRKKH